MATRRDKLLKMARRRGIITSRDAERAGIHSQHLTRLVREGLLERIARGHYRAASSLVTEHHGLVIAASIVPKGVVCLLSALEFHGIGTQLPSEVWMAVRQGSGAVTVVRQPIRIVRFSGAAFDEGAESHRVEGAPVRVYSVAKTIADLFKYRNRIGLDVALEALREAWRERKFTMEALDRAARACRVDRVMRPYVETIVS